MRTIKFRGRCAKDSRYAGEWVYGGLLQCEKSKDVLIVYPITDTCSCTYHVDPATVGQFTDLFDKNGNEIYEGDILLYNGNRRIVEWKYGTFGLSIHENGFPFQAFYELPVPIVDSTVIGNIHDNPEMLEKGGKQ